jgi:hypothetical protein
MLGIEIVNHDEVEVRARSHFTRPEPAEGQNRSLLAGQTAMHGGEIVGHAGAERADEDIG